MTAISETDRLKFQVLNLLVDREELNLSNAHLQTQIIQGQLNQAQAKLTSLLKEYEESYDFDAQTDAVNWSTGEVTRNATEDGAPETPSEEDTQDDDETTQEASEDEGQKKDGPD
jgi:hypothetical protein